MARITSEVCLIRSLDTKRPESPRIPCLIRSLGTKQPESPRILSRPRTGEQAPADRYAAWPGRLVGGGGFPRPFTGLYWPFLGRSLSFLGLSWAFYCRGRWLPSAVHCLSSGRSLPITGPLLAFLGLFTVCFHWPFLGPCHWPFFTAFSWPFTGFPWLSSLAFPWPCHRSFLGRSLPFLDLPPPFAPPLMAFPRPLPDLSTTSPCLS